MKRHLWIALLLIVAVAAPGLAGGKHHKKCDADPADCVKKMKQKFADKAWLGIEMNTTDDGRYQITAVVPDSPAATAGFVEGDIILSMNGHNYSETDKKAVKVAWSEVEPGSKAVYVVLRKGGKIKLKAKLDHVPEAYQKKWIKEHLAKYHGDAKKTSD